MNNALLKTVPWAVFFVLLAVSVVSDIRNRRVSNRVNASLFLVGLGFMMVDRGAVDGGLFAFGGMLTGLAIWLPMYAFRLLGAGDVKLFAAGSTWIGWQGALIGSLSTGLLGGVLGLAWLMHRKGMLASWVALFQAVKAPQTLQLMPMEKRERVPYAIAIAGGLICGWWWMISGVSVQ